MEVAITGCLARTALGGPQYGERISQSSATASTGPTIDEQRRPWARARSANARTASGPAATGMRLAPE